MKQFVNFNFRVAEVKNELEVNPGLIFPSRPGEGDEEPVLLLILPHYDIGIAGEYILKILSRLRGLGWKVVCVGCLKSKDRLREHYEANASEAHQLSHVSTKADIVEFFKDLSSTLNPHIIMITDDRIKALLTPFLLATFPSAKLVDRSEIEGLWRDFSFPQFEYSRWQFFRFKFGIVPALVRWIDQVRTRHS